MKLIVGLGNIGKEYENTRHNIGFMVAEELAKRWGKADSWQKDKNAVYIENRAGEKIFLIKPTTYMNLSGIAVADFFNFYHLEPKDLAVIQDDLDLPCGQLRIRQKGSAGGHNGIKSIQQHLGTAEFTRFKVGIGHPVHSQQAVVSHVLQRFAGEEAELIKLAVQRAADALELWLKGDMAAVMQEYNKKVVLPVAEK